MVLEKTMEQEEIKYSAFVCSKQRVLIARDFDMFETDCPQTKELLNKNATVTVAHSKTKNIKDLCKKADIIFLALGRANFLTKEDISEKTIIVDIGINFTSEGKLCGDASKDCYEIAKAYSPVPGGVGVMTNVVLMENLLKAFKRNI